MSTERLLVLKGCAGLGNRLLTTCAAASYASRNRRRLFVDWSDGQFGPKGENVFYQYFELEEVAHLTTLAEIANLNTLSVYPKSWKHKLEKRIYDSFVFNDNKAFPGLLRKVLRKVNVQGSLAKSFGFWQPKDLNYNGFLSAILSVLQNDCFTSGSYYKDNLGENVVVFADFAPATSAADFRKYIRLKPQILIDVKTFAEQHNLRRNAIGVHIRATDKKPTASLKSIFTKIKGLGLHNPVIFLATDNSEVANSFLSEFPYTISSASDLPEVPEGMGIHQLGLSSGDVELAAKVFHQSIMDMWLLSECEYLFYQGNSTFSIISSFLHSDQAKVFDWQSNK